MAKSKELRKFEIEAITEEITANIYKRRNKEAKDFQKSDAFASARQLEKSLKKLSKKKKELNKEISDIKNIIRNEVSKLRYTLKRDDINLYFQEHYPDEDGVLLLEPSVYEIRKKVEQKLTMALIPNDVRDRLADIVSQITNELS
jgi:alanyl-tRNA synthetase